MSTTFKTRGGEDFELVSKQVYGYEGGADGIQRANPGAIPPFVAGETLVIPDDPAFPTDAEQGPRNVSPDEITIRIAGELFRNWESARIARRLDGFSELTVSAPFESGLRPFGFQAVTVYVGADQVFTGTLVRVDPEVSADRKAISASAYGKPGVLQDCTASPSSYPVEFNDQNLAEIAEAVCRPLTVATQFSSSPGPVFERVALEPEQKIFDFLRGLARQRGFILADDERGALVFRQSPPVTVGTQLRQGMRPLLEVSAAFEPQKYYSHVSGLAPTTIGTDGAAVTAKNPFLQNVVRPLVFKAPDTLTGKLPDAVDAQVGRMLATAASYTAQVIGWRNSAGNLWAPGDTVSLVAPDAFIDEPYTFIVREVELSQSPAEKAASLTLVLPGVFSGQVPEAVPWA